MCCQEHLPEHLRAGGSRKPTRKRKQTAAAAAAAAVAQAGTPAATETATAAAVLEEAAAGARAGAPEAVSVAAAAAEQPKTPARGAGGGVAAVKLEHTEATVQGDSGTALGAEETLTMVSVMTKAPGSIAAAAAMETPVVKQQQKQIQEGPGAAAPDTPAQPAMRRQSRTRKVARRTP